MTLTPVDGTLNAVGGDLYGVSAASLLTAEASEAAGGGPYAYWDSRYHDGGAVLADLTGRGHDLDLNQSTANEPLWLPLDTDEKPYLYLPGQAPDYVEAPDSSQVSVTSDFDIRFALAVVQSATGSYQTILSKYGASGQRGVLLDINPTGQFRLVLSSDGTNTITATCDDLLTDHVPDGQWGDWRITWRASDGRVQFFVDTGSGYVQVGANETANAGSIFVNTEPLRIGSYSSSHLNPVHGKIRRAQIYDGINGTLVADFDPSLSREPHRTIIDSVGNVWTINRSTTGRKAALVDQPMFLFGTDDYMEAPDHPDLDIPDGQDFTVVVGYKTHNFIPSSTHSVVSKKLAFDSVAGWALYRNTSSDAARLWTANGSTITARALTGFKAGSINIQTFRHSGTDVECLINNLKSGTGSLAGSYENADVLRVGSLGGNTNYSDMEFIGAAIFRRALTDAEVEAVSREFGWVPYNSLLDEAIVAAVSGVHDPAGDRLLDITGHEHPFVLGGTSAATTNDPLLLPYDGEKYMQLPGVVTDYPSCPGTGVLDITGDIDIRSDAALDDWSAATQQNFISKDAGTRSWQFLVLTSGLLQFLWWDSGGTLRSASSTVSLPYGNGERGRVRVTLDVDNGAAGRTLTFYTSTDGVNWVQLGADVVQAGTTSIRSSNDSIKIGTSASAYLAKGKIYSAQIYDGIDGTLVADFNPDRDAAEPYTTMVSATTGETWTFNRSSTGRKLTVVDQNLLLFGTDDYAEALDHDELDFGASDSFTVLVLIRRYGVPAAIQIILDKKRSTSIDPGYGMQYRAADEVLGVISDGTNLCSVDTLAVPSGVRSGYSMVRNTSTDVLDIYDDAVLHESLPDTTTTSLASAEPIRLGAQNGTLSGWMDGEIMGVALIRRALSTTELQQLADELVAFNADRTLRLVTRPPAQRKRAPGLLEVV